MDDVKDKVKGIMKKVNNPFSSSSGKFKGQGRVLGSSSSSSSSTTTTTSQTPHPLIRPNPNPTSSKPSIPNPPIESNTFDPPTSTRSRPVNDCTTSSHIESCQPELSSDVAGRAATFVSENPGEESVGVVLRLMRNVIREPGNEKFRKIRMGNPKIKAAIGDARGGIELLECVGFSLGDDGGELWATMETPSHKQTALMEEAISLLERWKPSDLKVASGSVDVEKPVEPKKIDRQVRVFFSVPENVAAKIVLPDSFYNLSGEEIKREAVMRRKKMAESQLLIPKSLKEKQSVSARKKYKLTVIRIQFPDGVVLQGVFLPWESTTALYEFTSSALKEGCLEFELMRPAVPKPRLIPRTPKAGVRMPTLEEEDLVPSALIKFKPIETDSIVFTGLSNELLETSELLTSTTVNTL